MIKNNRVRVIAVSAVLGIFGACSDTKSSEPADTAAPSDSAAPTTEAAPTTTAAITTTTTPAPTPTTVVPMPAPAPVPVDLAFLRGDGLSTFDFGTPEATVRSGITLTVIVEETYMFPDDLNLLFFSQRSAQRTCWTDGGLGQLCAYFGAHDPGERVLLGWDYGSVAGPGVLYSAEGLTVNALVSAFPAIGPIEGGCYSYTEIVVNDMRLSLSTNSDEWFGEYAEDGTWTPTLPIPAGATIDFMTAGERIVGEGADC
ncbi:MAG: hypothetical protein ABL953_01360 [Ilumatobacteraceae bacterium]